VLLDATSRRRPWELSGRTSGNTVVNVPGNAEWIGRTVPVVIRRAGPNSVWGEAVSPATAECRDGGASTPRREQAGA
jgi:tRNA-2-methylthio-N6-dimethylallyladenosine synthase